ncbi:MAG: bifunctional riboflavin kinase/FAD synthetase [Pseudomonadota bacterium]|nr:bifunctional riboflavin kinase/FAD synthetase [Pseudomonadota bacterium]
MIWVPLADPSASKKFIAAIDPAAPPPGLAGAVVAIGNFDGVHRGHVAVIERARTLAQDLNFPCAVLTFEPHPADFFKGPNTIFRLTPRDAKARALEQLGIDGMIVITFDKVLACLPAEAFIAEILVRRLRVRVVVAGYDFHFGAGRSGTPAVLKEAGKRHGFAVEIVERVMAGAAGDNEAASSTAARAALEAGDAKRATRLLGHPFAIMGKVIHGQELGRTLGFPTANLLPDPSCRLRHGIYAVRVVAGTKTYAGVASYGRRPTFDNGPALLEAFLFDFSGDLYGETIEVLFIGWIRAEEKFDSAAALVAQMQRDEARAKQILQAPSAS